MICRTHNQNVKAICSKCNCFLCLQCIIQQHLQHKTQISFLNNILLLINNIYQTFIELEPIIRNQLEHNQEIMTYLQNQLTFYNIQLQEIFQNHSILNNLEFFVSVIEKQSLRTLYILVKADDILNFNQKQQLVQRLDQKIKQDDELYIKLKFHDFNYLLNMHGEFEDAQELSKSYLHKLQKNQIFFSMIDEKIFIQATFDIELDEYFQIQLGRNYYLIGQYDLCIKFMEGFDQNNEAQIYKGLSWAMLQQGEKKSYKLRHHFIFQMYLLLKKIRLHPKHSQDLIQALELQKIRKEIINPYKALYEKYNHLIFLKSLCYNLHKLDSNWVEYNAIEQFNLFSSELLSNQPMNYFAWFYKGVLNFRVYSIAADSGLISDKLIRMNSSAIHGYIIKGAHLIINRKVEEADELIQYLFKKFNNSPIVKLLECFNLFNREQYHESYLSLQNIPGSVFITCRDKMQFEMIILQKIKIFAQYFSIRICLKLFTVYQKIMKIIVCFICGWMNFVFIHKIYNILGKSVKRNNILEQAINLVEGFKHLVVSEEKMKFYHILQGKLLIDFGMNQADYLMVEEGIKELTVSRIKFHILVLRNNFNYDVSGLLQYQLGFFFSLNTILFLNKFDEAAESFKLGTIILEDHFIPIQKIYLIASVCRFIQGHFEEAVEIIQMDYNIKAPNLTVGLSHHQVLIGLSLFLQGQNTKSFNILINNVVHVPLMNFILSWILKEQNQEEQAKILISQLNEQFPQFQIFLEKYTFITKGPYSNYILNNRIKFDSYDNKTFYTIKFLPYLIESFDYPEGFRLYNQTLAQCFLFTFVHQQEVENNNLKKQLLKNYPFI